MRLLPWSNAFLCRMFRTMMARRHEHSVERLTIPRCIYLRQNQKRCFLMAIIRSDPLRISQLLQRIPNAVNRVWLTNRRRRVFIPFLSLYFLFNFHYFLFHFWQLVDACATADALVLGLSCVPYDSGLSHFHVGLVVLIHAWSMVFEFSMVHRRLWQRFQNLWFCHMVGVAYLQSSIDLIDCLVVVICCLLISVDAA